MPQYRRFYQPNTAVFITIVTAKRIPYFEKVENISLLESTLENVHQLYSFEVFAYVIMPDHIHLILDGLGDQHNFSQIIHSFKRNLTLNYKKHYQINGSLSLWQKRFWDHVIRDETDLQNHVDYIHWNPVKHKIVDFPNQYTFSSHSEFIKKGFYPESWGDNSEPDTINSMDFE